MYTYWWFGVFRPHEWVWDDLSSYRLPLIAALLFVVPSLFSKKIPRFNNSLAILMLLYCVLAAIADFLNGCDIAGFVGRTRTVFELFILVYVVLLSAEVIKDKKSLLGLILVIALSLAFHSSKGGIYALMTGANYYDSEQLGGFLSGSNAYALGTAIILFFMIFSYQEIVQEETRAKLNRPLLLSLIKWVLVIAIFGSAYNIVALQSRGSFIAVVIGIFIWAALQKKNLRLLVTGAVLVILALSVVPLPQGFEERIGSVFSDPEELDKSAVSRPHFWETAVNIAIDHPLGVGPGCYPVYYNSYDTSGGFFGRFRSVHSSHFQILVDTGFPGAIVWLLLLAITLRKLWKIRKISSRLESGDARFYFNLANALLASMLTFMMGGVFYEFGYNDITWLIFGLVIATESLLKEQVKNGAAEQVARPTPDQSSDYPRAS